LKFKVVFILFNVVIVISFLVIYFMPLAMLGWDYTKEFWGRNWGLPILFAVILGGLNGYFAFNWQLFRLLEREDWDGLIDHLEKRIIEKRIILAQQCRILINAYLVRSRLDSVSRLEAVIRERRPRLMRRLVMPLGVRHLLSNDPEVMLTYFGEFKDLRIREGGWVRWAYGFASLLAEHRDEALKYLRRVIAEERNPLLLLLSAYLLDSVEPGSGRTAIEGFKKRYTPERLASETERQRGSVQVVILARLIDEASDWLFDEGAGADTAPNGEIH